MLCAVRFVSYKLRLLVSSCGSVSNEKGMNQLNGFQIEATQVVLNEHIFQCICKRGPVFKDAIASKAAMCLVSSSSSIEQSVGCYARTQYGSSDCAEC